MKVYVVMAKVLFYLSSVFMCTCMPVRSAFKNGLVQYIIIYMYCVENAVMVKVSHLIVLYE